MRIYLNTYLSNVWFELMMIIYLPCQLNKHCRSPLKVRMIKKIINIETSENRIMVFKYYNITKKMY